MDYNKDDPFFHNTSNKRFIFEEEDSFSKRLKVTPYTFQGTNNTGASTGSTNVNDIPQPINHLPLLHPQNISTTHSNNPPMNTSQGITPSFPFPVYQYNTTSYYGQPVNQDTNYLPFNTFLPSPPGHSHNQQQSLVSPSQVYYFSSPPFLQNNSMRTGTVSSPYNQMNTITTLQHPVNSHIESPLTQMLHSAPISHSETFDQQLQSMKFPVPTSSNASNPTNRPQQTATSSATSTDKTKRKKTDTLKKKEGLEESSVRIINLLQEKGKMVFKAIHETLGIDYRRAYDILNILLTTSVISKTGKKRENKLPFVYQDGIPLPEPVELKDILGELEREQERGKILEERVAALETALTNNETTDRTVAQLRRIDATIAFDPLYRDLLAT